MEPAAAKPAVRRLSRNGTVTEPPTMNGESFPRAGAGREARVPKWDSRADTSAGEKHRRVGDPGAIKLAHNQTCPQYAVNQGPHCWGLPGPACSTLPVSRRERAVVPIRRARSRSGTPGPATDDRHRGGGRSGGPSNDRPSDTSVLEVAPDGSDNPHGPREDGAPALRNAQSSPAAGRRPIVGDWPGRPAPVR